MKKIFKAKRLDNGEWHVFSMSNIEWSDDDCFSVKVFIKLHNGSESESFLLVSKNTLCQYAGIDAQNGKIFEGDRVYIAGVGKVIAAITPNGVTFGGWDYQDVIEDIEKLTGHNIHDKGE